MTATDTRTRTDGGPAVPTPPRTSLPQRGGRLLLRGWRRLTSMRTALILLFLLAVAAVPGSLLPQQDLNPGGVTAYIQQHGSWGRVLDRLGMYDVFGSPWFAAIYLLLWVSLIGCIIPRIRLHIRAATRKPLAAPKNLARLPESGEFATTASPQEYVAGARAALGRRWRQVVREEKDGAITLSAEKGYSRETGNILFHTALVAALVLIAVGRLYNYQGSIVVSQGTGFCSAAGDTHYDSWKPGRFAAEGKVAPAPVCIDLDTFNAIYDSSGEATQYSADVTYRRNPNATAEKATIKVNHPLRLEGDRFYLLGHGFTPQITVRMPSGKTVTDAVAFAPTNPTTYYSEGAFKELGPSGANSDIGISGFFAPSAIPDANGDIISASPQTTNPVLGITVYKGSVFPNGTPQSIYSLNTTQLKQLGKPAQLQVGQTADVGDGVTVRFDGFVPWASIQVSHDPAQKYLLLAAVAMVLGLFASLGVRRRRLWLRVTPAAGSEGGSPTVGTSVVAVGGLARSDSGNFTTEFAGLVRRLREVAPVPDEADPGGSSPDVDADPVGAGKE